MTVNAADRVLLDRAWETLRERLGPADAMRFLSLIRNQPRDYQTWRDEHFRELGADRLLDEIERGEKGG